MMQDALIHAFGFLSTEEVMNARVVCKAWSRAVAETPVSYARVSNWRNDGHKVGPKLEVLARAIPNLRCLTITHGNLTDELFDKINKFVNLKHLDVSYCTVPKNLRGLNLPHLECLELSSCEVGEEPDRLVNAVFPNVHTLSIGAAVSQLTMEDLARAMPNLHRLTIMQATFNDELVNKINNFTNLKHLDLSCSAVSNALGSLNLPHLECLRLSCSETDEPERLINAVLPNLCTLSIYRTIVTDKLITAINNFSRLQCLILAYASASSTITTLRGLNLPHLEQLWTFHSKDLTWDLSDLSESVTPNLKELHCYGNERLTGDLASLHALSPTLVKADFSCCRQVTGDLLDLAHMPRLKNLSIYETKVSGDIRDIKPHHFVALEEWGLTLSKHVFGQADLQSVSEAPIVMKARYDLLKSRNIDVDCGSNTVELSPRSPDWYSGMHNSYSSNDKATAPPLMVCAVNFGNGLRRGWQWTNKCHVQKCEIHWFDPDPDPSDSRYSQYLKDMEYEQEDHRKTQYGGRYNPPTEQEYHAIWKSKTSDEIDFLAQNRYPICGAFY